MNSQIEVGIELLFNIRSANPQCWVHAINVCDGTYRERVTYNTHRPLQTSYHLLPRFVSQLLFSMSVHPTNTSQHVRDEQNKHPPHRATYAPGRMCCTMTFVAGDLQAKVLCGDDRCCLRDVGKRPRMSLSLEIGKASIWMKPPQGANQQMVFNQGLQPDNRKQQ